MDLIPEDLRIPKEELQVGNFLRSGGSGAVFKGEWIGKGDKSCVAIKMVRAHGKEVIADICKELHTMASFQCENICQVYGGCLVSDTELWLVLKYADNGNFHDYLKVSWPLPVSQQLSFALQAAKALQHLHTARSPFLHRDVKSPNFLVHNHSTLLLTDFGLSTAKNNENSDCGGTLRWTAPEVLAAPYQWSEKADIYSLGMFFYEIVSGEIPFQACQGREILFSKIRGGVRPKIPAECPKEFASIIKKCWEEDPALRPTATALVDELTGLQSTHSEAIKKDKCRIQ